MADKIFYNDDLKKYIYDFNTCSVCNKCINQKTGKIFNKFYNILQLENHKMHKGCCLPCKNNIDYLNKCYTKWLNDNILNQLCYF